VWTIRDSDGDGERGTKGAGVGKSNEGRAAVKEVMTDGDEEKDVSDLPVAAEKLGQTR